jgi:hypothetical protein
MDSAAFFVMEGAGEARPGDIMPITVRGSRPSIAIQEGNITEKGERDVTGNSPASGGSIVKNRTVSWNSAAGSRKERSIWRALPPFRIHKRPFRTDPRDEQDAMVLKSALVFR